MTTRITESNIQPGSVTANIFSAGVTLGGGVTIDQIIVTDENFANTANTGIFSTGDYLKLYGSGFQANANVYLSTTFGLDTQVTANVVSSNEIRLTIGQVAVDTFNLFLINTNGSIATKLFAISSYAAVRTAGWFTGGRTGASSSVNRVLFQTDTATASVRGPLNVSDRLFAGTGNTEYGWFGGGVGGSHVRRITFSSDTSSTSVRGTLGRNRTESAGVGDYSNFGWFGGTPSSIDRIQFDNDTATGLVRGVLVLTESWAATSGVA